MLQDKFFFSRNINCHGFPLFFFPHLFNRVIEQPSWVTFRSSLPPSSRFWTKWWRGAGGQPAVGPLTRRCGKLNWKWMGEQKQFLFQYFSLKTSKNNMNFKGFPYDSMMDQKPHLWCLCLYSMFVFWSRFSKGTALRQLSNMPPLLALLKPFASGEIRMDEVRRVLTTGWEPNVGYFGVNCLQKTMVKPMARLMGAAWSLAIGFHLDRSVWRLGTVAVALEVSSVAVEVWKPQTVWHPNEEFDFFIGFDILELLEAAFLSKTYFKIVFIFQAISEDTVNLLLVLRQRLEDSHFVVNFSDCHLLKMRTLSASMPTGRSESLTSEKRLPKCLHQGLPTVNCKKMRNSKDSCRTAVTCRFHLVTPKSWTMAMVTGLTLRCLPALPTHGLAGGGAGAAGDSVDGDDDGRHAAPRAQWATTSQETRWGLCKVGSGKVVFRRDGRCCDAFMYWFDIIWYNSYEFDTIYYTL